MNKNSTVLNKIVAVPKIRTKISVSRKRRLMRRKGLNILFENVANAYHRVNQFFTERGIDFFTEHIDVHVNHVAFRVEMNVPQMLGDRHAAEGARRVPHQVLQQREFFGGESDL